MKRRQTHGNSLSPSSQRIAANSFAQFADDSSSKASPFLAGKMVLVLQAQQQNEKSSESGKKIMDCVFLNDLNFMLRDARQDPGRNFFSIAGMQFNERHLNNKYARERSCRNTIRVYCVAPRPPLLWGVTTRNFEKKGDSRPVELTISSRSGSWAK
jgi:hypothetical protein